MKSTPRHRSDVESRQASKRIAQSRLDDTGALALALAVDEPQPQPPVTDASPPADLPADQRLEVHLFSLFPPRVHQRNVFPIEWYRLSTSTFVPVVFFSMNLSDFPFDNRVSHLKSKVYKYQSIQSDPVRSHSDAATSLAFLTVLLLLLGFSFYSICFVFL